ncbi:MAG: hypothetical protein GF388_01715 [Candidatus Aegiribacteria sp.]|nr:hypothetical protein [Candidatus Aegiribacteria sp.]MBD3294091.1 hypothetical protein [Candidatus Fermentibacteria bacterium]
MSPDSSAEAFTNFADFPGMLNPAKTYAGFVENTDSMEVYSQYPFSANYFKAVYCYSEEDGLTLLEADSHDYYMERLQRMTESAEEGSFEDVLQAGWEVMYPGANPYAAEMCTLLLSQGMAQVNASIQSGESIETAMEPMEEADGLAYNLIGDNLHKAVLAPEDYPGNAGLDIEEYKELLAQYAEYLDVSGNEEMANDVRTVLFRLEAN